MKGNLLFSYFLIFLFSHYFDVLDVCDAVAPSVHDDGRAVSREDNLHVRVEVEQEVEQSLLPLYVEADLGFVHEEDEGPPVLYEDREQDDEHLLLAAGQFVW